MLLALIWWQYGRPLAPWDVAWLQVATGSRELWAREVPPAVIAFAAAAGLWLRGVMDAGRVGGSRRDREWLCHGQRGVCPAAAGRPADGLSAAGWDPDCGW